MPSKEVASQVSHPGQWSLIHTIPVSSRTVDEGGDLLRDVTPLTFDTHIHVA